MSKFPEKIAIIGMSCRFPGQANSPEAYWDILQSEQDVVTEIPADRWGTEFYQHPDKKEAGRSYTFAAGVLDDIDQFDAAFFGISPREAAQIDPQQRLLLELTWESFENANLPPEKMAGSDCAVYVGIASTDYVHRRIDDLSSIDSFSMTGNTASIASNRLSYTFDLRGPSVSVDTACSSSLVAVNQACQSIWSGEASCAVAGGVNLLLHPFGFVGFSKASMLSPDGRCKAFDESGNGYVRSEGAAVVILKPLSQAEKDGDVIHAVIRGSSVNCDGHTQGITVPSTHGQADLLRKVYNKAGVNPDELSYLEAHGTGTAVGDPLETAAIAEVLAQPRKRPLTIGSAKTNVGHLETASGMAGLFKIIMSVKNRTIARSLHFNTPNKRIDFAGLNLHVAQQTQSIQSETPLLMGVNSFGFGGANAHVIIEEYTTQPAKLSTATNIPPLLLSANGLPALRELADSYIHLIRDTPDRYYDIAYTSFFKRQRLQKTLCLHGETTAEIIQQLADFSNESGTTPHIHEAEKQTDAKLTLVFSGNGCQWQGMGQALLQNSPYFKTTIKEINSLLRPYSDIDLFEEFAKETSKSSLADTAIAQPLLFALQVGIVRLLQRQGMHISAVIGHSVGEVAAAWAAGCLTLKQAVDVIYHRSHAQAKTQGSGKMAAISLDVKTLGEYLDTLSLTHDIEIAGINGPNSLTASGTAIAIDTLCNYLTSKNIQHKRLDLDYAFHSHLMDPVKALVLESLNDLTPKISEITFISTVTGQAASGISLDNQYWWDNIREPVRFYEGMQTLLASGHQHFIEIGAHPILRSYINECARDTHQHITISPGLSRENPQLSAIHDAADAAMLAGCAWDLSTAFPETGNDIRLPNYPWQRERFWYPLTAEGYNLVNRSREHPLLGHQISQHPLIWENTLDSKIYPYLADHVVDGAEVLPGSAYVEMAITASQHLISDNKLAIENIEIHAPILLDQSKHVQFILEDDGRFEITSRDRFADVENTVKNCTGRLLGETAIDADIPLKLNHTDSKNINSQQHYALTEQVGLHYGEGFQCVDQCWVGPTEAISELVINRQIADDYAAYHLHPAMLDSGFQILVDILAENIQDSNHSAMIPVQIGKLTCFADTRDTHYLKAQITRQSPHSLLADFHLYDKNSNHIATLQDCRFRIIQFHQTQHLPDCYQHVSVIQAPKPEVNSRLSISPEDIANTLQKRFPSSEDRVAHFHYIQPLFDALVALYAWEALRSFESCQQSFSLAEFIDNETIDTAFTPFIQRLLDILEDDELASRNDEHWTLACETDYPPANDLWLSLLNEHPQYIAELTLLARCGKHIPEVLINKVPADTLISPSKSSTQEHWQNASPSHQSMQKMLLAAFTEIIEEAPSKYLIRVLQIGATPLTATLINTLETDQFQYVITDEDPALVDEQISHFKHLENVSSLPFDLHQEDSQLKKQAHFDLIIAIHPHRQTQAFHQLRQCLKGHGILLSLEDLPTRFSDITAGLHPEWWENSIDITHPLSELMSRQEWRHTLETNAFKDISLIAEQDDIAEQGSLLCIASRAAKNEETRETTITRKNWILVTDIPNTNKFAQQLSEQLGNNQQSIQLLSIGQFSEQTVVSDTKILFLAENTAKTQASSHCQQLLTVANQLMHTQHATQLTIITQGAFHSDIHNEHNLDPDMAALWGFGRVLMNEHPELATHLIDLCQEDGLQAAAERLVDELLREDLVENEVLLLPESRHVLRLRKTDLSADITSETTDRYKLNFSNPGQLKNLQWQSQNVPPLNADEIEIIPKAAGLNFRDVMYALGLLSDEAVENGFAGATLGMELSGTIARVGADITNYTVGDEVIGFAPACFSSHVICQTTAIAKKPEAWSFSAAATIPTTFFTVYYALNYLAKLEAGEKILIHGAAGGIGIAAIQYAKHCGAEIYATAGTDEKRDFVKMIGADYVFDSRNVDFADDIMALTENTGVDIVLNSLAGEAINRNLSILKPFGRFLELGKRDFYENSRIGLRPFRNNISYFGIDADQLLIEKPQLAQRLFLEMMSLFKEEILHPLPFREFTPSHIEEAFRYMQQSQQIGKIIINFEHEKHVVPAKKPQEQLQCDPSASYLITGGLSGFGLKTATWLVEKGAQHLILVSRSGKASPAENEILLKLRRQGIEITQTACDVTNFQALQGVINDIPKNTALKGIIHAAMVLDDALIQKLNADKIQHVIQPKLSGAWNLHELSKHQTLDFFVVYSSVTTSVGNPGQANYVAANYALESLCHWRRQQQLPASYVAWGAIDDVGYLTKHSATKEVLQQRLGGKALQSDQALMRLEHLLLNNITGATIIDLEWQAIQRVMPNAQAPRFYSLGQNTNTRNDQSSIDLKALSASLSQEEIIPIVVEHVSDEIVHILRLSKEAIDTQRSVFDLGMDSLMGMELVLAIEERFGVKLPVMALTEGASIQRIAERILEHANRDDVPSQNPEAESISIAAARHGHTLDDSQKQALSEAITDSNNLKNQHVENQ
ncbi:MAG: Capsular polysaccharide biosynthesis fatty acid synthase WcbR [uncultured Thiotrichaceae bacterium]|uniref:Capsular polysaccharide biosynthesis fatty acid synthase WcbR n=1 Tax=uncultured Thiotrichaceae bacterium TaxID=298394 RepID=A0A6S6SBW2_9GAMM|nr:MAG: Capsular polysaccharide biosynthesis fatty acid synthase WcbR [uncultured Thiotrichaceae bacterium]